MNIVCLRGGGCSLASGLGESAGDCLALFEKKGWDAFGVESFGCLGGSASFAFRFGRPRFGRTSRVPSRTWVILDPRLMRLASSCPYFIATTREGFSIFFGFGGDPNVPVFGLNLRTFFGGVLGRLGFGRDAETSLVASSTGGWGGGSSFGFEEISLGGVGISLATDMSRVKSTVVSLFRGRTRRLVMDSCPSITSFFFLPRGFLGAGASCPSPVSSCFCLFLETAWALLSTSEETASA